MMSANRPIEIRQLPVPDDGMDLVSLLWHKGSPWVEDLRRRILGKVPGAADHFFVAFDGNRMVATAWYTVSRKDSKLGLLGHIYTRPEYRRQGISARLVKAGMAHFHDHGGVIVQLFTSTPYTVPFYERLGYENVYANQAYHETDWYMRYPADSQDVLRSWFSSSPCRIRQLEGGDLPQYCLLYNLEHQSMLKDWAQSIGWGLEAEFAFINSLGRMSRGEGVCYVLENDRTIVGIASLMRLGFPHHAHVAATDFYVHPEFAAQTEDLVDVCLARCHELAAEFVYAMGVDENKRRALAGFGFQTKAVLPRHYKVGNQHFDCELLQR